MKLSKREWVINIENVSSRVADEYGQAAVDAVFHRYDVHDLSDLASCHYSEVFADLEEIAND